jgi:hypothetical protein
MSMVQKQTFTVAQWEVMTHEQASALGRPDPPIPANALRLSAVDVVVIPTLAPERFQDALVSDIPNLDAPRIQAMTLAQLRAFRAEQWQAFSAAQIHDFPDDHFAGLADAQLIAFRLEQIAALRPAQIAAFNVAKIQAFSATQIAALPVDPHGFPTTDHLQGLPQSGMVPALTLQQIAKFDDAVWQNLPGAWMPQMTPEHIQAIPPDKVALLPERLFAELRPEQIPAWLPAQVAQFSDDQLGQIPVTQVGRFTPEQIAAINPQRFVTLSEDRLVALSTPQIQALSYAQLQQLAHNNLLDALTNQQVRALTPWQVSTVGAAVADLRVRQLSSVQLAALLQEQLEALVLHHLGALTDSQIGALINRIGSADVARILPQSPERPVISALPTLVNTLPPALGTGAQGAFNGLLWGGGPTADKRATFLSVLPTEQNLRGQAFPGAGGAVDQVNGLTQLLNAIPGAWPVWPLVPGGAATAVDLHLLLPPIQLARLVAAAIITNRDLTLAPPLRIWQVLAPWYDSGRPYGNRSNALPGGLQPAGAPSIYRESDIYPNIPGINRGTHRIVINRNTNNVYYTSDHYATFMQIQ